MQSQYRVLVVDDEPSNFDVIEAFLTLPNYELSYVPSGRKALELLNIGYQPDVILLDVMMPEMSGIELCQHIKANPGWQAIPIIIITALIEQKDLSQCLLSGADDFIGKPVKMLELRARVHSMLRIYQQYRQIHSLNQSLNQFNQELEQRVQQQTWQLQRLIDTDELTGLPSRAFLVRYLNNILPVSGDSSSLSFAFIHIDCDQFQLIKSSLGHDISYKLLQSISQRLEPLVQAEDMLVRLGEDEFGLLMESAKNRLDVQQMLNRITALFETPFQADSYEIYLSVCMGVALPSIKHCTAADILQEADTALQRAKMNGRGEYVFFDPVMHNAVYQRLQIETDVRRAIAEHEFQVHYQPIWHLRTNCMAGFEALIRWNHPTQGYISPEQFIPCIEQTGLIVPIGMYVLEQACIHLQTWRVQGTNCLFMSVNLSARQFTCPSLLDDIDSILSRTGTAPQCLKLEITESAIAENPEEAIALIQHLRDRQIQVSLDDFGTGYSSLSKLHQFPLDSLKIDRTFIQAIDCCDGNLAILNTIIALAKALDISIIAEGIETSAQLEFLRDAEVDYGQGFYLSRPISPEAVANLPLSSLVCRS